MKIPITLTLTLILIILFTSCNKDKERVVINDFTTNHSITINPYKFYPYSMLNIHIQGYVDDTILLKLESKEAQPILKLKGEINETWKTDYYGEGPRTLIFEPYKASEGEVKIEFSL